MEDRWSDKKGDQKVCPARSRPDGAAHLLFWSLAAGGAGIELWSKYSLFSYLAGRPFRQMELVKGFVNLIRVENSGAAFSIARGQRELLIWISIAAMVVVAVMFLIGVAHRRLSQAGLGLMTAGIAGNLYDRLFNDGYVRDFIDVYVGSYHWPTFNAADSFLCVGVGLLMLANFTSGAGQKQRKPQTAER